MLPGKIKKRNTVHVYHDKGIPLILFCVSAALCAAAGIDNYPSDA